MKTAFKDLVFVATEGDNIEVLQNVKHIHGTSDRILPFCFVKSDYKVLNGGHFMTLDKSTELTQLIKGLI